MRFFTDEVKVGIGVLIAIVVLIFSAFIVKEGEVRSFRTKEYTIKVIFNFVGGLKETAPVRLAGVKVGQVEELRFIQEPSTKVEATITLKEAIQLRQDAQFSVTTIGLLGEKYVEIVPGSPEASIVQPGATLIGKDAVDLSNVLNSAGDAMEDLGSIISSVREGKGSAGKLLNEEDLYDNLNTVVKNLAELSEELKQHPWKLFRKN
jgi:phospholipid/cholesterol/gamma-HCH transport system substrate-binding protein